PLEEDKNSRSSQFKWEGSFFTLKSLLLSLFSPKEMAASPRPRLTPPLPAWLLLYLERPFFLPFPCPF
ncbi:MAG: hypothetical protein D6785_08500, partial [Planctomycetota bacterium]